jgi:hypothetical protein
VLVVRAGKTPRQAIVDAVGHVAKTRLQGVVLNHAAFRSGADYYYGSGYGYGEEQSADSRAPRLKRTDT